MRKGNNWSDGKIPNRDELSLRCNRAVSNHCSLFLQQPRPGTFSPWRKKRYEITPTDMDTSPTALFESYEQDFRQLIEAVQEKLEDNGGDEKGLLNSRISPSMLTLCNQKSVNLICGE